MPVHPLAEVFGFPTDVFTEEAERARAHRLCPFGNRSPNCTKASVEDPLGVCSVFSGEEPVITCPVRFRQQGKVIAEAADFFFGPNARYTSIPEVRLKDATGRSAGNIDYVLVSHDEKGRVLGYGALEVQAVYISGNVRSPFEHYMEAPRERAGMDWRGQMNYPRPDFLSSSRKRLAPQLISKGGILNTWGRKLAVALDAPFFETLPHVEQVAPDQAEVAWLIYRLARAADRFVLETHTIVYTKFAPALLRMTQMEAGDEAAFLHHLQQEMHRRGSANPLDTGAITDDDL